MSGKCLDCKYFLDARGRLFCGLGINLPKATRVECGEWESKGELEGYIPISCCKCDYLFPSTKGLEQLPSKLKGLGIYHFSRSHTRVRSCHTRTVLIDIMVDSKDWRKVREVVTDYWGVYFDSEHSKLYTDRFHFHAEFTESVRNAFLTSRERRHRHRIE